MAAEKKGENNNNAMRKGWRAIWAPRFRLSAGVLVIGAALVSLVFWVGFENTLAYTDSLEFCISCHEMEAFVYEEYKEHTHFANDSGVRAVCADCHVPHSAVPKLVRKVQATLNEVPRHLLGTIDTREEFEARREHLAERVWARMRENDSSGCRSCHSWEAMLVDAQPLRARREHQSAVDEGKTCIDCHKGLVHKLPESMRQATETDFEMGF